MSDNNSLGSMLYAHFSTVKLSIDTLSINMGSIDARITEQADDDVYFILSVPSDGFSYDSEGLQVDSAVAEFELHVANCRYNSVTHAYEWSDDRRFAISTDPDRVNISVYKNDDILAQECIDERDPNRGLWDLPPTISKGDDEDINELVCRAVQVNSHPNEIIKAIEALLASYS